MKYNQAEKYEIIRLVEQSTLAVRKTLEQLGVSKSTFYEWYHRYLEDGFDGLESASTRPRQFWNRIPDSERQKMSFRKKLLVSMRCGRPILPISKSPVGVGTRCPPGGIEIANRTPGYFVHTLSSCFDTQSGSSGYSSGTSVVNLLYATLHYLP